MPVPNIIRQIAQKYVSGLTKDELLALPRVSKIDATSTMYPTQNEHIHHGRDYPVKKSQYVHRSRLIVEGAVHVDSIRDRQLVAYFHPWVKGFIEKVGKALWSTPPIFTDPATEDEEEPKENETVKIFWDDNRLSEMCKKAWEKSQVHGICFYYPYDPDQFFEGYSGPPWYVYSMDEMGQPVDYRQGHPIKWKITHSNKEKKTPTEIAINQGIFNDYKNTDDFTGEPSFLGSWDLLIDWIWMDDAVNAFDQRMGNGFILMVVPNNTEDDDIADYEEKLKNTRTEKGLVVKGAVDEPVQLQWVGMAGMQVDFVAHLQKIEDLLAFNMGFPKRWIMGDAEGAMESSGKDALQVNIQLKNLFNEWVIFIKRVLKFHGLIKSFKEIVVKPPFEMQLSEQEKVALNLVKTQTIAAKSPWCTLNELRKLDGLPPIAGGDDLMDQMEEGEGDGEEGIGPSGKLENNATFLKKPTRAMYSNALENTSVSIMRKNDAYDLAEALFHNNQIPIRTVSDICGISPSTVVKVREKFDLEETPSLKCDRLAIKCDSVQIDEDLYLIEDVPVVLPQEKEYKHLGYTAVRPRDQIEQIFNDPTYPKEFRIGVTPTDDHSSKVPLEILDDQAVGTVKFNRLDEHGNIRGNIYYNLKAADRILGKDNWIRQKTLKGENPPTSIALYSKDIKVKDKMMERNLDVRSFVFTQHPRNEHAGQEVRT